MNLKHPYSAKKILDMHRSMIQAYPESDKCSTIEKQEQYDLYSGIAKYYVIKFMETVGWNDYVHELGLPWNGAEEQEIVKKAEEQVETETDKEKLMQLYAQVATLGCRFGYAWDRERIDSLLNKIEEKLKK